MNPLELLEDPLRALLDFLHDNLDLTYGWSIVVLTVIVRIVLLPLVIKQYSSMRRMQLFAPQMKELQAKHKGDRRTLNEELMRFYKENNINPFASCLPLVAQLPVFIALYYVLQSFAKDASVEGGSVSFMWLVSDVRIQLQDLGWGALVLLAIYAVSQLLSTELSATPNMPQSQRRIMRALPLIVVVFAYQFPVPSGLVLYWLTTNLWTCGQQLVMRHRIGLHVADEEAKAAMAPAAAKKGSRTPSNEELAAAAAAAEEAKQAARESGRGTPRKRRRKGEDAGQLVAEATEAEGVDAPEARMAPEARTVPEHEPEPEPEPESAPEPESIAEAEPSEQESGEAAEAAPEPAGAKRGAADDRRRQPRPKSPPKQPSRPAQRRSKKKR